MLAEKINARAMRLIVEDESERELLAEEISELKDAKEDA